VKSFKGNKKSKQTKTEHERFKKLTVAFNYQTFCKKVIRYQEHMINISCESTLTLWHELYCLVFEGETPITFPKITSYGLIYRIINNQILTTSIYIFSQKIHQPLMKKHLSIQIY